MILGKIFGKKQSTVESKTLKEYVVLDFETTGVSRYYSHIIQIGAIKVKNGKVKSTFQTLINPEVPIPEDATAINHITDDMVKSAPIFESIVDQLMAFVRGSVIVGYNIGNFDLPVLNTHLCKLGYDCLKTDYIDLYRWAKTLYSLDNYKLTTLASYLNIDASGAHDALADCSITYQCYEKIVSDKAVEIIPDLFQGMPFVYKPFIYKTEISETSRAINVLRMIVDGIIKDKSVSETEFWELQNWITVNESLRGNYPFNDIENQIKEILDDGIIEDSELTELEKLLKEWMDPIKYSRHKKIKSLVDKHIVVTGDFKMGGLNTVKVYIESRGGIVDDRVTRKTDYVVAGDLGSDAWVAGNYGTKVKKALEYKGKGIPIEIVPEKKFVKEVDAL